ncbi:methyltransferase domain-containing protein [Chloroflexota bacterium]
MRQIVVNEQLDELEVHPPHVYENLVELCISSAQELLERSNDFIDLSACPACESKEIEHAFDKHGYVYWSCQLCSTLFVSPRPSKASLDWYLFDSPSAVFRRSDEYCLGMESRFAELAAYRANWITELYKRVNSNSQGPIVDLETRIPDYLIELEQKHLSPVIAAKPLTKPINKYKTTPDLVTLKDENASIVSAFEIIEHQTDPLDLVQNSYEALSPGGLLVITTRSSSGFDIQVLWEQCATIFPIEHINLLSVEGMKILLNRAGFELLEISTPGQLDVQMIEKELTEKEDIQIPRFLRYFFTYRDQFAKHNLQQFLQENLLSSYMRVVARKVT